MAKKTYNSMTSGAEWKCILLFAIPILLSMFLQQLYNTVDGIVVGNFVSSGALAAVGNCAVLANIFIMGSTGLANGCGIVVGQFFGAERIADMRKAAANSLFLFAVLGLVSTLLVAFFADYSASAILDITDEAIRTDAADYIRIYAAGLFFTFIYNAAAGILRAVGDSRAVLYFLLISTVSNIILDILFVAGFGMGVAGAALATVIAQALCTAVSIVYMMRRYPDFRFSISELRPEGGMIWLCLKLGIPGALQLIIVSCGQLFLQRLVNSFGEDTMAAFVVGTRFDNYCTIPAGAVSQAISSFTGQNVGANRYDRVRRGLRSGMLISLTIVCVLCVCLYVFAEKLALLFGVEGLALDRSVEMMRYLAFCFPVFAVYMPFIGLFQGAGNPGASAVASLTALGVRVGLAYILVYCFGGGYASCWQPMAVGWGCAMLVSLVHYARGGWKTKSLVKS